jgi:PhnB protein
MRCTPFLLFDGNCAEAMTFYKECLGGELVLTKLGETPMKAQFPSEKHERIINARLTSGEIEISATDWMSDQVMPRPGNMMSIFVIGEGLDELRPAFDKLSQAADQNATFQPLHDMPFGTYGQFTDKFGVPWIFKGDKAGN